MLSACLFQRKRSTAASRCPKAQAHICGAERRRKGLEVRTEALPPMARSSVASPPHSSPASLNGSSL